MSRKKHELIKEARRQYGYIAPCANKQLQECFTEERGKVMFWFNDSRGNTHMVSREIDIEDWR
jgi:hypothetical protein